MSYPTGVHPASVTPLPVPIPATDPIAARQTVPGVTPVAMLPPLVVAAGSQPATLSASVSGALARVVQGARAVVGQETYEELLGTERSQLAQFDELVRAHAEVAEVNGAAQEGDVTDAEYLKLERPLYHSRVAIGTLADSLLATQAKLAERAPNREARLVHLRRGAETWQCARAITWNRSDDAKALIRAAFAGYAGLIGTVPALGEVATKPLDVVNFMFAIRMGALLGDALTLNPDRLNAPYLAVTLDQLPIDGDTLAGRVTHADMALMRSVPVRGDQHPPGLWSRVEESLWQQQLLAGLRESDASNANFPRPLIDLIASYLSWIESQPVPAAVQATT